MSLMVLQPLKAASVAASAQEFESRFIIGTRPSARQNQSFGVRCHQCFAAKSDEVMHHELPTMRSTPRLDGIIQPAMRTSLDRARWPATRKHQRRGGQLTRAISAVSISR
jgi:hypothetical protein